jgi:hypothetical protein
MRIKPLAFTPPHVPIDADLAWLLRAAFARDVSCSFPKRSEHALQIARATQLSGRVAARLGAWRGSSSSGALAQDFSDDYYANVAKETLLMQAQQQIAELAERCRIPLIVVKFGGLRLAGVISPGARVVADLDILVPKARARDFWRALLTAGFLRTNTHEYPHQLEALVDPYGAVIDLHVHLSGVVVERGGFATADQLIARGLATRMPQGMFVPSADVLAAHAIVHALVQNRSTPQTYSPLRMLSDVMDLRRTDPNVVHNAASYLAPELGTTCETLERLCAVLADGAFDGPSFDGTSEQTMLWHCLAARLDFNYAERLRAAGLANKFRDGSSATEIARYIADLLYPAETALDFLYGPALGTFARVRRRLRRPLDLVIRTVRRSVRSRER